MAENNREKSWIILQKRGLELYEYIQQSLDPKQWEVPIESEGAMVPLDDFKKKAKLRLNPHEHTFSPTTVASDSLVILDALDTLFYNVRNRLEDSFKSVLIVNEDMNEYVKGKDTEIGSKSTECQNLIDENKFLREKLDEVHKELKQKELGIKPLADIITLRVKEITKLYNDFKKAIGEDGDMKTFIPVFEREVDQTIKLMEIKKEQILKSAIDYSDLEYKPKEEEPEEEVEEEAVAEARLPGYEEVPIEVYDEAKARVDSMAEPTWSEQKYMSELDKEINRIEIIEKDEPGTS